MRTAAPGESAAKSSGAGQRAIHCSYTGRTRATGVCCNMTSLTRTPHGVGCRRQGRSRAATSNQRTIAAISAGRPDVSVTSLGCQCGAETGR
jgi:hypothetical protein